MQNEPTIHQLESLIKAFREDGGSDAELSMIAREISERYSPKKQKPIEDIFPKSDHPSIAEIKSFRSDPRSPIKSFFSLLIKNPFIKYPFIFITSFLIIFAVLNFPLIVRIITPTKDVQYETVKEVINPNTEKSAALEPGEVIPSAPTLKVAKISVTAPIVFTESTKEADIKEGLRSGVVHYYGTAKPGEAGNTFLTGHSSNYWWEKGGYNYVFATLDKLQNGDQAVVYYNGNKYLYEVTNIKVVEPTDISVLAQTDAPTLTLMTCTPPGTSWKRLIVQFNQISPKYEAPVIVEKKVPIQTQNLPKSDSNGFLDWLLNLLFRN